MSAVPLKLCYSCSYVGTLSNFFFLTKEGACERCAVRMANSKHVL